MPKPFHWNKIVSSALVFSLFAGTSAYAAAGTSAGTAPTAAAAGQAQEKGSLTTPFSDVKGGHWAEKHIAKLYFQGIITGLNGAFRPADNVSQQEAVIMALRFMGKASEAQNDAVVFPTAFVVSDFYKPYVEQAFRSGLLDRLEEYKLAESGKADSWGTRKASREWITKLAIRAIGQKAKADSMAGGQSSFADAAQIGAGYAGYVNAAASLKLVNGVTAAKFDPKGAVTRAMLAAIFSRAEAQLPVVYEGQTGGVIASLTSDAIVLYDKTGKETTYRFAADTLYARADSEKLLPAGSIQAYTDATVIAKNGKALFVEQTGLEVKTKTLSGTLASVVAADKQLYIKLDNGKFVPVDYADSTRFTDTSGAAVTIDKLKEGSSVTVTVDAFRTTPAALDVRIVGALVSKTGQGTFVGAAGGKITIKDSGAEAAQSWDASAGLTPTWQDRVLALTDLRAGDSVTYEVTNSILTKITLLTTSGRTITGTFSSVNTTDKTIVFKINGKSEVKDLADNVHYVIEGMTTVGADDLAAGDSLEITVDAMDKVTQIKVLNRKVETLNGVTILTYLKTDKTLVVRDSSGKVRTFVLTDKVRFDLDGTQLALASAESFLAAGRRITVGYTGETVLTLQFAYKYTGKVTALNTLTGQLTVSLANGTSVTVPYQSPVVEIYGSAAPALSDVKIGDTITARMDTADQTRVISILVHRTLQQEVASVDAAAKKVRLKAADGTIVEWPVGSDWMITDEMGAALTLAGLNAGTVVNVTFAGKQPVALKTVKVTVGKVTAVAADKVTVTDYKGLTGDIALGTGYRVINGGTASTSVSVLAPGDRVDARKDENGNVLITVLSGAAKTFWKYDAAANEIQVRHAPNENYKYALNADTVISLQNGAALAVGSLIDGDAIVLYVYGGKLIEVVKQ